MPGGPGCRTLTPRPRSRNVARAPIPTLFWEKEMRRALVAALAWYVVVAIRAEETPPPGPPWAFDFVEAQRQALKEGKAIFVYLTKTH